MEPVPFNYQHKLIGCLHKWMGNNDLHDTTSLYSLGWLQNGKLIKDVGLFFPKGAIWEISFHDSELALSIIDRVYKSPEVCYGMRVRKLEILTPPSFSNIYRFRLNSPILIRKNRKDSPKEHITFDHPESDEILTNIFRYKLKLAGFENSHLSPFMGFDRSYRNAKTKLVTIKNISLRANLCPVIVMGTPEAVQFAWEVGAGQLTGSGFGQLKLS